MARYTAVAIIMFFLLIPSGVLLGFAVYYGMLPFDIAIALISLFPLVLVAAIYYPYIKFSQLRGERKRLVERDLPFFAIYASVLQSAGLFLDQAFRRLIGNPLFPEIKREGRIVEKEIRLGSDPSTPYLSWQGIIQAGISGTSYSAIRQSLEAAGTRWHI